MSTERKELTVDQKLMQEVVNRIADKYLPSQTDGLTRDAKKITDAILNYKNDN